MTLTWSKPHLQLWQDTGSQNYGFQGKMQEKADPSEKKILAFKFWYFLGKKQILKYTFHWRCAVSIPSSLLQTVIENRILGQHSR